MLEDEDDVVLTAGAAAAIREALLGAKAEIEAMEESFDEYVSAGDLMEQIERAIELLEE